MLLVPQLYSTAAIRPSSKRQVAGGWYGIVGVKDAGGADGGAPNGLTTGSAAPEPLTNGLAAAPGGSAPASGAAWPDVKLTGDAGATIAVMVGNGWA